MSPKISIAPTAILREMIEIKIRKSKHKIVRTKTKENMRMRQ